MCWIWFIIWMGTCQKQLLQRWVNLTRKIRPILGIYNRLLDQIRLWADIDRNCNTFSANNKPGKNWAQPKIHSLTGTVVLDLVMDKYQYSHPRMQQLNSAWFMTQTWFMTQFQDTQFHSPDKRYSLWGSKALMLSSENAANHWDLFE